MIFGKMFIIKQTLSKYYKDYQRTLCKNYKDYHVI